MPSIARAVLRDVAEGAGVSVRTASRVLNDDPNVAAATRARVQDVMRSLSYTPDEMARSLRAGTDATFGLVVESVADPFFAEFVDAVELAASQTSRTVLISSTHRDPDRERELVRQMVQRRVAGLLLVPTASDHSWLESVVASTPLVLADRPAQGFEADLVRIDDRGAIGRAVEHLVERGHRRIAYVGDLPDNATSGDRLAGFHRAAAEYGLTAVQGIVRADCPDPRAAARATHELLAEQAPTAVISASTRCSLGVVPALHAQRRTDVALVALGDFAMADTLEPGVTVIDHPAGAVGRAAVARMAERLADPGLPVATTHVPVRLVERGSGELLP